jgi:uncharacterized protein
MRLLITGATGFIGRRLAREFERPVVLSRRPEEARRVLPAAEIHAWKPEEGPPPAEAFEGVEAIFHLAGDSVASGRWTATKKARIRSSRVTGTMNLVEGLKRLKQRPRVLVSASAVGYYGTRGDEVLEETAPPGKDFLAEVCQEWETAAGRARELGLRVVTSRTGMVLGRGGGALARMLPPFKFGLGGRLGDGRAWMPWVHLDDVAGLMLHAANTQMDGPMNSAAPNPVTNREFTRTLAKVLHRPAIFPVPRFALALLFGELSTVLLASQRVVPRVAEKTGYLFHFTSLEGALREIISRR